jgi:hypothetical protein
MTHFLISVVIMREIGLTLDHSMDTMIPVANVVFLFRLCSMSLPRTGRNHGNYCINPEPSLLSKLNSTSTMSETIVTSRYSTDYGMFRFCIANTEEDWRPETEQYKFIEHYLSSVDRQKQPWLIFLAHRVLGCSKTRQLQLSNY